MLQLIKTETTKTQPTARELLAKAIEAHKAAVETTVAAATVAAGARAFVSQIEADVDTFKTVDADVASERAKAIKAAILSGVAPDFSPSQELHSATIARAEATNRLEAARQASAALASEHAAAGIAEAAAKGRVAAMAHATIVEEADELAASLLAAESHAREIRIRLSTLREQRITTPQGTLSPVRLSPMALEALEAHKAERNQFDVANTPAWCRQCRYCRFRVAPNDKKRHIHAG